MEYYSYKFRIYPNREQIKLIEQTFGYCRFVYNQFLSLRINQYKASNRTIGYFECCKKLTELKKCKNWLKNADSTALRRSLKFLDEAYQNFFRRLKKGGKPGFPKFKSKHNNRQSFNSNSASIKILDKHIKMPKLGLIKCKLSKQIEGRILNATISKNPAGKYFVSICCTDTNINCLPKTGKEVGIDLGIKDFAVTSDGEKIKNPKYLKKYEKLLIKHQRRLSRKPKGSNNRQKQRIRVALIHEKISNCRADFLQKLSTKFVKMYDKIHVENLKIKNMVKNHKLAKCISDVSWGEFVRQLEYKCSRYDKKLIKIDTLYASSQICNNCGFKNPAVKDLKIRSWICPQCQTNNDRDYNASLNILGWGTPKSTLVEIA